MPMINRDEATGLRHSVLRFPDGSPPRPTGCRWCGVPEDDHDVRWSDAASFHIWAAPTAAQLEARVLARIAHGISHDTPPTRAPSLMDASILAFRAANDHIRAGCTTCTPAARLPEMCPDGQRLALAAVDSLAADALTTAHRREQTHP